MNYELTLDDFELGENFKKRIADKIDHLLEVSPSDAGASSKITKTKTGYLGILQIFSSQGKFVVETTGRNLDDLVKSLLRLMYRQIKKWRNCRFLTE